MYLGKTIRIYPTTEQKRIIDEYIEFTRVFYNYFLKYSNDNGIYEMDEWKKELKRMLKNNTINGINEIDYLCLLKELDILSITFQSYFQDAKKVPKFRKKTASYGTFKLSGFRFKIYVEGNRIILPVLGAVKYKSGYNLEEAKIYNVTIKKTMYDYYEASLLVEEYVKFFKRTYKAIGIDLGIRKLITTSAGKTYVSFIDFNQIEEKIIKMKKSLNRKKTASKNSIKEKMKIEKMYRYRFNCVKDLIQKATTELVRDYDIIYMEDLDIHDLLKGQKVRTIRRNLLISSFGYIKSVLQYKCKMYGKKLFIIDKYYPSSQICSNCGFKHNPGSDELFVCPLCGIEIDRDYNAAINILNYKRNVNDGG